MGPEARKSIIEINHEIEKFAELSNFERTQEIRTICDGSQQGLGAVLQQSQTNGESMPLCFAKNFLPDFETKHSIMKLVLSAINLQY